MEETLNKTMNVIHWFSLLFKRQLTPLSQSLEDREIQKFQYTNYESQGLDNSILILQALWNTLNLMFHVQYY